MVSEPMIGEIRLQWWRDTLDMIKEGKVRSHEVVQPLAAVIGAADLPRAPFGALIDARSLDLDPAFPSDEAALITYLRDTAGSLTVLAMRALGGDADMVAQDAGFGIGMARYLSAIPALAGQGGKPLPGDIDWQALRRGGSDDTLGTVISSMASDARAAIARARDARRSLPRQTAAAFMEVAAADRTLAALSRTPRSFDAIANTGASPFRSNLSALWRGISGRW